MPTLVAEPQPRLALRTPSLDFTAILNMTRQLFSGSATVEAMSDAENEKLWSEEVELRDADWDSTPRAARLATDVFRDARAKLK